MRFEGEQLKQRFEEAFGHNIEECTNKELWFLTLFAKHVRMRCRNNAAFNNYMNRHFAPAKFKEVQKVDSKGQYYTGLQITTLEGVIEEEE